MFKIHYVTAVFILASYCSAAYGYSHVLTNDSMSIVKKFINVSEMTQMHKFRRLIYELLMGKVQSDHAHIGHYEFNGNKYSVQGLREQESLLESNKEMLTDAEYAQTKESLKILLEQAKHDFKNSAEEFRSVSNAKKIMAKLIEESLIKRNRQDSILLSWTQSKCDEDEEKIFHEEVLTFKVFEEFLIDLYNFLGDLIESCPEANHQYEQQIKKFSAIRKLSTEYVTKNEQSPFLAYVRDNYLEKLKLEEITPDKIKNLYGQYQKTKK